MALTSELGSTEGLLARVLVAARCVSVAVKSRTLELLMFGIGAALRISMRYRYDATWSFDSDLHWEVVTWMAQHRRVPPVEAVFQAQHPPLYYALSTWLYLHHVSREQMVWFSIACGVARLALIWLALELHLPGKRWARVVALALAAIIPASIHLDGMNYPEPMSGMLNAAALVLVPYAFRQGLAARWRYCLAIGLILGIAMLTKISAAVTIGTIGLVAFLELLLSGRPWRTRFGEAFGWATLLALVLAVCGWYFARNVRDYGRPFVTTFDLKSQHSMVAAYDGTPLLDRRSLGFLLSWSREIYEWPYCPAGYESHSHFFPVAFASTFVDYWNYSFSGTKPEVVSPMNMLPRPITPRVLELSRQALLGGTVILVATVLAWFAALRVTFRRRDFGRLTLVLVPCAATAAAAQFAMQYPVDSFGVVKGAYMTFGAAPMYALFGLAAEWASQRVRRWPLLGFMLAGLFLVASYTFYCRFGLSLLPGL